MLLIILYCIKNKDNVEQSDWQTILYYLQRERSKACLLLSQTWRDNFTEDQIQWLLRIIIIALVIPSKEQWAICIIYVQTMCYVSGVRCEYLCFLLRIQLIERWKMGRKLLKYGKNEPYYMNRLYRKNAWGPRFAQNILRTEFSKDTVKSSCFYRSLL